MACATRPLCLPFLAQHPQLGHLKLACCSRTREPCVRYQTLAQHHRPRGLATQPLLIHSCISSPPRSHSDCCPMLACLGWRMSSSPSRWSPLRRRKTGCRFLCAALRVLYLLVLLVLDWLDWTSEGGMVRTSGIAWASGRRVVWLEWAWWSSCGLSLRSRSRRCNFESWSLWGI